MELINTILKLVVINICVGYCYFKILYQHKPNLTQKIIIFIAILLLSIFQSILKNHTPFIFRYFLTYLVFSIIYSKISNTSLFISIILTIVSFSLTYIANFISLFLVLLIEKIDILHIDFSDTVSILFASIINVVIIYLFFRIKRFKNGFPFLKKNSETHYSDIYILIINSIIIFMYFFVGNIYNIPIIQLFICFIFFTFVMFIIIQKTFILYHKQKLQTKALKDYEQELSETKQKLATALEEKQKLVKSNHEFYHRQAALNKKLDDLRNQNQSISDTEFAEEYSNILDRINNLSAEYDIKTYTIPNLTKTNIVEIDDMLLYMQSECVKNNIEFIFKLECDINYIIENFISKSQLETLLGDLIRNAIIAINYSSNNFKSIMIVLGIKDEAYELSIFDSGIEFEIETLLNLGIQPSSTHLNDGGTGIGFITTFETIHSCNASFIINEITNNNYTKSLEIRFDNKNEYIIVSNRKEKINEMNKSNRNIILK